MRKGKGWTNKSSPLTKRREELTIYPTMNDKGKDERGSTFKLH